jgi:cytochrome P450
MTDAAERMGKNWAAAVQAGRPVSVAQDMVQLTLGVVVKALFSTDISADALAISEALTFLLGDITFRFDRMWYPPPSVPTPHNRQFRRALRALDESVYRIIRDRKEGRSGGADLLAMLMEAADEETGARMSDAQLRDEVVTIMVAGHETTANALAWAWHLLSENPEAEGRLHAEVDAIQGDRPAVEDLARLSYTRMVFEETLRLYPPVWLFDRKAIADDEICGYRVRPGDTVILSPYVTHRLPEFWEAPNQFEPERFEPGQVNRRIRYAYFPFGGGPRQCIGNNFALMEGTLVLATLARCFRLRPVAGHSVVPRPLAALRPSELVMRPEARS